MRRTILLATFAILIAAPTAQAGYKERNTRIIHHVFGKYGAQAVRVAKCESGLTVNAVNGQYVNLFQMGHWERKTYGWHTAGSSAWVATRAAYRYFVASGRDWSPWTCKPWK